MIKLPLAQRQPPRATLTKLSRAARLDADLTMLTQLSLLPRIAPHAPPLLRHFPLEVAVAATVAMGKA
jgi:hypothetical protein